ncbi:hypothetical protein BKA63DRAFT_571708 [Paraphoma chrysanthemicola]|nr:hypothetical protein BKA63DRAFT_571708 [Paraphoma chrysanthemicola]
MEQDVQRHKRALLHEDDVFKRSFSYTIWKSAIIEGWLGRMEKYFEGMNSSASLELILGSTNQINASSDEDKLRRFTTVRKFVEGFSSLAQTVHQQCSTIPSTSGWPFGLGIYAKGLNITTLEFLPWIDVELRFSAVELDVASKFQLRVPFDKYAPNAHGDGQRIKQLVSNIISKNGVPNSTIPALSGPVCKLQADETMTIESLGALFRTCPDVYRPRRRDQRSQNWRLTRREIIRNLLDLAVVSWGTEWTRRLCSFGIHVETTDPTNTARIEVFVTEEHSLDDCNHTHEDFCLKRLGLLLVEILLGTPLRMSDTNAAKPYEQMVPIEGNVWRAVDRRELKIQLFEKMLDELVPAVNFCLEEDSQLVNIENRSSLLYWCNNRVCTRVNKWYEGEGLTHERMSAYLQRHPENARPRSKRPETPFYRRGNPSLNVSTDNIDENAPQHAEKLGSINYQVTSLNQEAFLPGRLQDIARLVLTHV